MAEFKRTGNGIGYILCNYAQSIMYCENNLPKCGECNEKLMDDNCMFIPYTNEVYHKHCGENVLKNMKNYVEDKDLKDLQTIFDRIFARNKEYNTSYSSDEKIKFDL